MNHRIAVVGAGPTAIYCLQALLKRKSLPRAITLFERQHRAGQGTPYSAHWSDAVMLANIASIEIPPLPQRLVDWLRQQSDAALRALEISRDEIGDRTFYPRLVLGEYLAAQLAELIQRGRSAGVEIDVQTQSAVTDVRVVDESIELTVDFRKAEKKLIFDYVVLATGHQWPADPELRPGYFTSPWPASALARIANCSVGIRGTSLSAIDAVVMLANRHGEFIHGEHDELRYAPASGAEAFSMTMLSRRGLLPEADFFHPLPYAPLAVCTPRAVQALIDVHSNGLLDDAFELFRRELSLADPAYAQEIALENLTPEEFSTRYFEPRMRTDPFAWAQRNLAEAAANFSREFTVPWRYAILRMHEVFGLVAPHLSDVDFVRFTRSLKAVFVDNYATVPHESIRRLLALRAAGKLAIESLDGARIDLHQATRGATLLRENARTHFPVFIEAIGQRLLTAKEFPFPSLRRQGIIQDLPSEPGVKRGIAIDGEFHPISAFESSDRLFCLSLPYLLGQHPFAQGITSSAEMAEVVAAAIESAESGEREAGREPEMAAGA